MKYFWNTMTVVQIGLIAYLIYHGFTDLKAKSPEIANSIQEMILGLMLWVQLMVFTRK